MTMMTMMMMMSLVIFVVDTSPDITQAARQGIGAMGVVMRRWIARGVMVLATALTIDRAHTLRARELGRGGE